MVASIDISVVACKGVSNAAVMVSFAAEGNRAVQNSLVHCKPLVTVDKLHETAVFCAVAKTIKSGMEEMRTATKYHIEHFAASIGGGFGSLTFVCKSGKTYVKGVAVSMFRKIKAGKAEKHYRDYVASVGERPDKACFLHCYHALMSAMNSSMSFLFTGKGVDKILISSKPGETEAKLRAALVEKIRAKLPTMPDAKGTRGSASIAAAANAPFAELPLKSAQDLGAFVSCKFAQESLGVAAFVDGKSLLVYGQPAAVSTKLKAADKSRFVAQLSKICSKKNTGLNMLVHMSACQATGHAKHLGDDAGDSASVSDINKLITV